jgi:2-dehydro-3-deoxyglucarate aldolase/4-hydroxy-2-oxoheptanedioate aldolase
MRTNPVKQSIQQDGVCIGTMVFEFNTTGIARIVAEAGAEFALFDMEHTGWTLETMRMLFATSRSTPVVPMVRVPATE